MKKKLTYIDLFAGCGGLSLGLHQAGWKGVFAIEKSKDAFETLRYNLIENKNHFDWPEWLPQTPLDINYVLKKYKAHLNDLRGKIDLVTGGPPCQGFSSAGRRKENDQRNQLVKSYIRFIKAVQPKVIFFENVTGFTLEFKKNKEKGKKYSNYVEKALRTAGYTVTGRLINFGDFGIPQKRTRFILIGIRNDIVSENVSTADAFFSYIELNKIEFLIKKNLSVSTNLEEAISDLLKSNGTIPSPDTKDFEAGVYSKIKSRYQEFMRGKRDEKIVVDSHRFVNHRNHIIKKFNFIIKNSRKNKNIDKAIRDKYGIKKHTVISLAKNDKCPTLTTLPDDHIHYSEPRILTVREYARIQSFPDWYEFKGKYTTGGKVRTKEVPRYTQIGNAIPPLFAEQSGFALIKLLSNGSIGI